MTEDEIVVVYSHYTTDTFPVPAVPQKVICN